MEPVLVLFFDLYSDDKIFISGSRLSFCPAYTFYKLPLITAIIELVNDFDLRRLFYSRQSLKGTYHSSAYTDYKWIL